MGLRCMIRTSARERERKRKRESVCVRANFKFQVRLLQWRVLLLLRCFYFCWRMFPFALLPLRVVFGFFVFFGPSWCVCVFLLRCMIRTSARARERESVCVRANFKFQD